MAKLPTPTVSKESQHWYDRKGTPFHTMLKKDGVTTRPTNIHDAKELGLYPSFSAIVGIFAKPTLDKWKLQQVALASMRIKRGKKEPEKEFINRMIEEAFKQVEEASDFGVKCHAALDKHVMNGTSIPRTLAKSLNPVLKWIVEKKIEITTTETCIVSHRHGYAGTFDLAGTVKVKGEKRPIILDFKTRKTKPDKEVEPYEFQAMQPAAYGAVFFGEDKMHKLLGANLFISSTEEGRFASVVYSSAHLCQNYKAFLNACEIWRHLKGYDPREHAANKGKK